MTLPCSREQPEDSFVLRDDKAAGGNDSLAAAREVGWEDICRKARASLPRDVALFLDDTTNIRAKLKENVLSIEIAPGFIYGRFNKSDVLNKFAAAASELTGREIRANLSELIDEPREKRSLDDLKAFKEVRFI